MTVRKVTWSNYSMYRTRVVDRGAPVSRNTAPATPAPVSLAGTRETGHKPSLKVPKHNVIS